MKNAKVWIISVGRITGRLQPVYVSKIDASNEGKSFWENYQDAKAEADRQQAERQQPETDFLSRRLQ